ncbi:MAG: GNAT family N-acetyltransferase [Asticcacaulis sp.]|uniref:GNAT family N-acetyltransferase n=1 Tax=Asticcacaulis sp. TaxID=1872648 RepID=UPI0039E36500
MLTCDLITPSALTDRDIRTWRAMCALTPLFRSPLLSPDFTRAVAMGRDDVFVAVFRQQGQIIGFLPHHRRPHRFARPVGAPFSDYSALITFPDAQLDGRDALKAAGIDRFQAIGLIDPHNLFGDTGGEADMAYGIDLEGATDTLSRKHRKNVSRHRRNLIEAHGEIDFIVNDRNRDHFDRMLRLKREQLSQNGLHDFMSPPWAAALLERLFEASPDGLHGSLLTMTIGGKPALFHYGPRLGDRMHPWISAYDPAFGSFSPGSIFLMECQAPLKAAGVSYYDLSTGQSHYKNSFSNLSYPVRHVGIYGASPSGRLGRNLSLAAGRLQQAMGGRVSGAVTRLNRRFDQIACLELDLVGRAKGVAHAVSSIPRRLGAIDAG